VRSRVGGIGVFTFSDGRQFFRTGFRRNPPAAVGRNIKNGLEGGKLRLLAGPDFLVFDDNTDFIVLVGLVAFEFAVIRFFRDF